MNSVPALDVVTVGEAMALFIAEQPGALSRVPCFSRATAGAELNVAYCNASRHLHLTGISAALSDSVRELVVEMAAQARSAGRSVSFDPNLRPRLWPSQQAMIDCMNQLATSADLVMPGLAEGQLLTGCQSTRDIADFYLARGTRQVVIKLGAQGAYFANHSNWGTVPGLAVPKVVDTVGAGDGFAVGVISALLEGMSLRDAAARGNAIGARVVQFPGDCDGLPNRVQLTGDHV